MTTFLRILAFALFSSSITSVIAISYEELDIVDEQQPKQFPCPNEAEIYPCECSPVDGRLYMDCSAATTNGQLTQIFATADFIATDFYAFTMDSNSALSSLDFSFNNVYFENFLLENCAFTEITTQFFSTSSTDLSTINLFANSQLVSFPFSSLQLTENVTTLVIDGSKISYVPPIISPKLRNFAISNSPVSSILPGTFSQVYSLAYINFAADKISTIRTNSIPISSEEMILDFSNNTIREIEAKSFVQAAPSPSSILTSLDLSNNRLTYLGENTIPITRGIGNIIRLENNMIDTLDANVFYSVIQDEQETTLLNIHLENNNLKALNQTTFENLMPSIDYIWAEDNPLECACDIAWLVTNPSYLIKISPMSTCADDVLVSDLDPIFYSNYC